MSEVRLEHAGNSENNCLPGYQGSSGSNIWSPRARTGRNVANRNQRRSNAREQTVASPRALRFVWQRFSEFRGKGRKGKGQSAFPLIADEHSLVSMARITAAQSPGRGGGKGSRNFGGAVADGVTRQSDNVPFEQSRNVPLTAPSSLGCKKDSY